jgi:hypothetical protein
MDKDINSTNTSQPLPQTNQIPNQPIVEPQNNKLVKVLLYAISAIVFMVIGAFGYGYFQSKKEVNTTPVTSLPTPTTQQEQSSSPTSIPTTNIYEGWKTYKHPTLGYEFKYPSNAILSEIGDMTKSDCVSVKVGLAYLSIKSPTGAYGGCVVTGMGADDEIKTIEENVLIQGKTYQFEGNSVDSSKDPDAKKKLSEFLRLSDLFGKESVIEYGGYYNQSEANSYLNDKQTIKQVVTSFQVGK